jgi:hypothetical protein
MSLKDAMPGGALSAATLRQLGRDIDTFAVQRAESLADDDWFLARIAGTVAGGYSFVEQWFDGASVADKPSGRTNSASDPAVSVSGSTLTTGGKVLIRRSFGAGGYAWEATSASGVTGTGGDNQITRWDGSTAIQGGNGFLDDSGNMTVAGTYGFTAPSSNLQPTFEGQGTSSRARGVWFTGTNTVAMPASGMFWIGRAAGDTQQAAVHVSTDASEPTMTLTGVHASIFAGDPDSTLQIFFGTVKIVDGGSYATCASGTIGPGATFVKGFCTSVGSGTFVGTGSANTFTNTNTFPNTGLTVKDTNDSHALAITPGSDLTAARTFTLTTGDANRTLDISAGSVTVTTAGNALTSAANAGAQRTVLGLGSSDSPTFDTVNATTFSGAFSGDASNVTSLPAAELTGSLPAISGASLTSLNASNLSSGTVAAARLPIGSSVQAWDADLDALAALSGTNTIYYRSAANTWSAVTVGSGLSFSAGTLTATGGAGVTDGDKGDITVSGSGATWTVDAGAITYAKLQDVSATQRLLGRNTAGSGDAEEVTLSQALDWASGTAADGNILTRSSGAWVQQPGGAYSVLKDVDAWTERVFANTNAAGSDPFIGAAISSGTNTTAPSGTALDGTRYGGVLLRQSATANSGYLYQTVATAVRFGTQTRVFRAHVFHATALANRTVRVGFHDSATSADAVDGVYFEIVAGVATGKTATNSTRSSTGTTHTATVNVWYIYEIEVNTAGTLATFRVLDTSESQLFSATLTTNIPTASGRESGIGIVATANTGAAADICVLGYMGFGTRAGYNRMRTAYAAPASGTVMRGHIDGLTLSYNSASLMNIAAGQCTEDTGTFALTLGAFTKTIQSSGSWTAGTGNNGLDTGAIANSTWYHVYVIAKADGTSPDILFSTSGTAPTMPSTYTLKRRIGAIKTGLAGIDLNWLQRGDTFLWTAPQDDVSALNPGTSAVTRTLSTPPGVRTLALLSVGFDASATGDNPSAVYLSDLSQADSTPSVTMNTYVCYSTSAHIANTIGRAEIWTNTSAQIRSRLQLSAANTRLRIQTHGWVDLRGRDQ